MCYLQSNCKKYKNGKCNEEEFCIRKYKEDRIFDIGLIDESQRIFPAVVNAPIDPQGYKDLIYTYIPTIEKDIVQYVKDGWNMFFYSSMCGNGKTMSALKICKAYVDKVWVESDVTSCRVLFISVPRFLLELKANISKKSDYIEHIYKYVLDADLVVWDDIGSKCGTEFEIENMLSLINTRIDTNKSNIYTSNIGPNELESVLGKRLASRIGMSNITLQFTGYDKRGVR